MFASYAAAPRAAPRQWAPAADATHAPASELPISPWAPAATANPLSASSTGPWAPDHHYRPAGPGYYAPSSTNSNSQMDTISDPDSGHHADLDLSASSQPLESSLERQSLRKAVLQEFVFIVFLMPLFIGIASVALGGILAAIEGWAFMDGYSVPCFLHPSLLAF